MKNIRNWRRDQGAVRSSLWVLVAAALATFSVQAAEIYVPDDYDTIQEAIDAVAADASLADTIIVREGTYSENLSLTVPLVLHGEETARALLEADDENAALIRISGADQVRISNFTLTLGKIGIEVEDATNITLTNNVVEMGDTATALSVANSAPVYIRNNAFYQNATAVIRDSNDVELSNNIFYGNRLAIDTGSNIDNISHNLFYQNTRLGTRGNNAIVDQDPLLVGVSRHDFHLRQGSPAIDVGSGDNDVIDDSTPDIGAYGGPNADVIPFPVQNLNGVDVSDTVGTPSIDVTWSANQSYLVTNTATPGGYKLYYDSDASGEPYAGADAGGGTLPSPIDVGNVTSYRLADLSPSDVTLTKPVISDVLPQNGALKVTWQAVAGASGYKVYYGLNAVSENVIDAGDDTQYLIAGLANGATYRVAVSAVSQTRYYLAVVAYDNTGEEDHVSTLSTEATVALGTAQESALSDEWAAIPEIVQAYPLLPDEGCFVATAAFGYYDAQQVMSLRRFRDDYLKPFSWGRAVVAGYYRHSPPLARFIAERPVLRKRVAVGLMPVVAFAQTVNGSAIAPATLWFIVVVAAPTLVIFTVVGLRLGRRRRV